MKKCFSGILFALVCFFVLPRAAYAHFPATDGPMTVILHVDPNDDPVPGQRAVMHFLFDDSTKRFSLSKCNCTVTISEAGQQLFSKQFTSSGNPVKVLWGDAVPFVFPNRDVYEIVLTGKPNVKNAFRPFGLKWYFRVDQYPLNSQGEETDPSFIYFIIGYFCIFIFTAIGLLFVILY